MRAFTKSALTAIPASILLGCLPTDFIDAGSTWDAGRPSLGGDARFFSHDGGADPPRSFSGGAYAVHRTGPDEGMNLGVREYVDGGYTREVLVRFLGAPRAGATYNIVPTVNDAIPAGYADFHYGNFVPPYRDAGYQAWVGRAGTLVVDSIANGVIEFHATGIELGPKPGSENLAAGSFGVTVHGTAAVDEK